MIRSLFLSLVALILAASVFIFFRSHWAADLPPFSLEIAAGFLGAIITVIVTAVLLSAQTSGEVQRDKSIGVFRVKLGSYSDFLMCLDEIIEDSRVDSKEIRALRQWAMRLSLIAGQLVSCALADFIEQSALFKKFRYSDLTDEEKQSWRDWHSSHFGTEAEPDDEKGGNVDFISIGLLLSLMKADLGEDVASTRKETAMSGAWLDQVIDLKR